MIWSSKPLLVQLNFSSARIQNLRSSLARPSEKERHFETLRCTNTIENRNCATAKLYHTYRRKMWCIFKVLVIWSKKPLLVQLNLLRLESKTFAPLSPDLPTVSDTLRHSAALTILKIKNALKQSCNTHKQAQFCTF